MKDDQLREAWAKTAAHMHGWPSGATPERDADGRFSTGWHEWEFTVFRAGYELALSRRTHH